MKVSLLALLRLEGLEVGRYIIYIYIKCCFLISLKNLGIQEEVTE